MATDVTEATWKRVTWYIVLTLLSIVVLFPVYMTLVRALSTPAIYVREGQPLYPVAIQWDVWSRAWDLGDLDQKVIVSTVVSHGQGNPANSDNNVSTPTKIATNSSSVRPIAFHRMLRKSRDRTS